MWLWQKFLRKPFGVLGPFTMALAVEGLLFANSIGPWMFARNNLSGLQVLEATAAIMVLLMIGAYWIAKVAVGYIFPDA